MTTLVRTSLSIALVLSLAGVARAQDDKLDLKLDRRTRAGERLHVVEEVEESRGFTVKTPNEAPKTEEESESRTLEFDRDVVSIEHGNVVAKELRAFKKFKIHRAKDEDGSLEGKSVVIVRGGGGNEALVQDGTSPGALALDYLATEKEREVEQELPDNPFAPPAKLAVGETWSFDLKKFIAGLGAPLSDAVYDMAASKGTGKLARTFEKNGAKYAEFEVAVKLKCKAFGGAEFTEGGVLELTGKFEACIDGTRPDLALDLDQKFSGTVKADAGPGKPKQEISYSFATRVKHRHELVASPPAKGEK